MVDHFVSASQLTSSAEAVILGKTPPSIKQGLSTRWIGWAMGILFLVCVFYILAIFFPFWMERAYELRVQS